MKPTGNSSSLQRRGGGLRTAASCSWDLEKFECQAELRFLSVTEPALLGDGGYKGRTYRLSVLEPFLRVENKNLGADKTCFFLSILGTKQVLKLYNKELPDMNYASNSRKQSAFLKGCVSKGCDRGTVMAILVKHLKMFAASNEDLFQEITLPLRL
ncbi:Uncharacterized protein Rs2_35471 [Raphanus sativus]|nr:Uncharacterized protein Rs2_35471 [Raphanus sativus]